MTRPSGTVSFDKHFLAHLPDPVYIYHPTSSLFSLTGEELNPFPVLLLFPLSFLGSLSIRLLTFVLDSPSHVPLAYLIITRASLDR